MPLFKCERCGCIENTATSNYWGRFLGEDGNDPVPPAPALCSACDPEIGKWHDIFLRQQASLLGYKLANDGFIYNQDEIESEDFKWRMKWQGLKIIEEGN